MLISRRGFACGLALVPILLPARAAAAPASLAFNQLYVKQGELTQTVQALAGRPVEMVGYMAPPLKAEASFFVLTSMPMSFCPFCETEAQWPSDIVLVLTDDPIGVAPFNVRIRVAGTLDLGFQKDAETGFVSLIRLTSAEYRRA